MVASPFISLRCSQFLGSIVGFDGLCLNDARRVGTLPVLGLGGDCSSHVAGTETERNRHRGYNRRCYSSHDFVNLLLTHGLPPLANGVQTFRHGHRVGAFVVALVCLTEEPAFERGVLERGAFGFLLCDEVHLVVGQVGQVH